MNMINYGNGVICGLYDLKTSAIWIYIIVCLLDGVKVVMMEYLLLISIGIEINVSVVQKITNLSRSIFESINHKYSFIYA